MEPTTETRMPQDRRARERVHGRLPLLAALLLAPAATLWGCGDAGDEPIVGSMKEAVITRDAMFVEKVRISLPFKTVVHNGEARKVIVRGEDNLLAQIDVVETGMSDWEIVAPENLEFEQHQDIEIEIPFIDMVQISIRGDIEFADDPIKVWNELEGENLPED